MSLFSFFIKIQNIFFCERACRLLFFSLFVCVSMSGAVVSAAEPVTKPSDDALKQAYKRPNFIPFPKDYAYTPEKVELGKTLFFDPRLSKSNVTSCSTCHNPSLGWGGWGKLWLLVLKGPGSQTP